MSTITSTHAHPTFGGVRAYRIAVVLLSAALVAVTALAVFFATSRATAAPAQLSTPTVQVSPSRAAPLVIQPDPECAHARVLC
jgi:hypothetical protein